MLRSFPFRFLLKYWDKFWITGFVIYFVLFIFSQTVVQSFTKVRQGGEGEEIQCIVCSDEPPSVKFEPCGHTIACKGKERFCDSWTDYLCNFLLFHGWRDELIISALFLGKTLYMNQAFSQNLKSGRPGGMSPHKFVKALVHFSSFSLRIGRPQDTRTPFWLKACSHSASLHLGV